MRSSFHTTPATALVRQLTACLPAGAATPADGARQDLAERLAQWLHVADAIALRSALPSIAAVGARAVRHAAHTLTGAQALQAELQRVRAVLSQSITTRDPRHQPEPDAPDTEFALGLQRYQDQQRRMEMSVDALRGHVRQTLAQATPRLAQLAALDAVLAQMLGGREQRLLNQLPTFLKARFTQLRQQADACDNPSDPRWLQTFHTELEQTLLAELEHRLQPVVGLIESLDA